MLATKKTRQQENDQQQRCPEREREMATVSSDDEHGRLSASKHVPRQGGLFSFLLNVQEGV